MLSALMLLALAAAQAATPPVPGLCSAPVPADPETPGCYQTGQLALAGAPKQLYWHVVEFATPGAAQAEQGRHRWSALAQAHSRTWLYVLGDAAEAIAGGERRALIGPLRVPDGPVTAHFSEAIFPPGMKTRVHSHPGPEAFYVVEGEQCMDTPDDQRRILAGGTYIVDKGPHLQAAPKGRRNLVLILAPAGQAPVVPGGDWTPSDFCSR